MLSQSKTAHQAEIDAACELIDFWRFNADYARGSTPSSRTRRRARGTASSTGRSRASSSRSPRSTSPAIGGNLPTAPALMGNTVVWKPASTARSPRTTSCGCSQAAGLPPASSTSSPAPGATIGDAVLANPDLAGIHFTGSTGVFHGMWRDGRRATSAATAATRGIVGETGGKDFIFAHPSADADGARDRDRARRLRVPGPEVLGGVARLRPASLWHEAEASGSSTTIAHDQDGRRRPTSGTSWARSSTSARSTSITRRIDEAKRGRRGDRRRRQHGRHRGLVRRAHRVATDDPSYRLMRESSSARS